MGNNRFFVEVLQLCVCARLCLWDQTNAMKVV